MEPADKEKGLPASKAGQAGHSYMKVIRRRELAKEASYRDVLRRAALHVSQVLSAGSVDEAIPTILATIGGAYDVDRVLVIEDRMEGETHTAALCYAWQRESAPALEKDFFSQYPSNSKGVAEWTRPIREGKPVTAMYRNVRGAVADLFRMMGVRSMLLVPITVGGSVWGCVGIDSCRTERHWTRVEIELVEILANLIGITILRDRYIKRLRNSEEQFRTVAETAHDAIILADSRGLVRFWNPAAQRILGYTSEEMVGQHVHDRIVPEQYRKLMSDTWEAFAATGIGKGVGTTRELSAIRKDGVEIPVELALAAMQVDGEWCAVGVLRDISARKQTEQRIAWLARTDVLTELPNRKVFVDELQEAIERSRRSEKSFAVYYLDLDHFKDVNDTLGHPAGDLLLKQVAGRLKSAIRETDKVARFGGDEFAILATEFSDPTDAGIVATKIISAMKRPFRINGAEVHSGATIGIACYAPGDEDAETLLAHADVALYRAKSEGRGTFRFFTDAMHNDVRERVTMLGELREAIARQELFLVYQPQVDIESRAIVGLEALVRWRHPQRGVIYPAEFIGAAENSGLILTLGEWVLFEVCRQARRWKETGIALPIIAVNVSPTQFKAPSELSAEIAATLQASGIQPKMLEVELTETAMIQASRYNSRVLQELRAQGLRVAIDDFGTGYSCLDYLRRYPVSRIKIAQTFVAEIAHDAGSAAITRATIGLARELSMSVIAEGVETEEQVALLKKWGCKEAQGFYFSKPLSSEDACELLRIGRVAARNYAAV